MKDITKVKPRKIFWMTKPDHSWFSEYSKLSIVPGPDRYNPNYYDVKGRNYKQRFKTVVAAANHIMNLEGIADAVEHTFAGSKHTASLAKADHPVLKDRVMVRLKYILDELRGDYTDPELRDFDDCTDEHLEKIYNALSKPILYDRLVATLDRYFEELKR